MKLLLLNLLLLFSLLIFCQNQEINYDSDYTPIKSMGEIPVDYKKLATEKYYSDINSHNKSEGNLSEEKKKFLSLANYELNQTLFSGRVLFGDKITTYLNKILDELLKNDTILQKKIRIYAFKSSSVNAGCTSNGTIFINIGLIPYLKNEAELAFIISHEISHFVKQHSLNSYIEKEEIFESKESSDEKINKLFTQSKEKEFEADSLGVLLFLKSDYNISASFNALDMLYYSYLPYKEITFDKNFFNSANFNIPKSLFLDSLSPISSMGNFNDRYLTHPNVIKRKALLTKILEDKKQKGTMDFIISKNMFEQVQELSRFENIRLCLLHKKYGDVIYFAYEQLQKYPNNAYLKTAICKALYGLAKYKNIDKYQEVAQSYHRTEGEIQQIHYLLRKLNTIQINVLAIKYIQKTLITDPENSFIKKLMNNLIEDLVLIHKINIDTYFNKSFADSDENNKLFHKNAFVTNLKDNIFIAEFEQHYPALDSINKWDNLAYKDKLKIEEVEIKKLKKYGLPYDVQKIIVLDPFYKVYHKGNGNYIKSEEKKNVFDNQIKTICEEYGLNIELINSNTLSAESLSSYHDLSILKEWMDERWSHDDKNMIPLFSDQIENIIHKHKTKYLYHTGVYESPPNSYYFMILYDLQSGTIKLSDFQLSKTIAKGESYRLIKNDIELINKKL